MATKCELDTAHARILEIFGDEEAVARVVTRDVQRAFYGTGELRLLSRDMRIAVLPAYVRWRLLNQPNRFNPAEFVVTAYWAQTMINDELRVTITRRCGTSAPRRGVTVCYRVPVQFGSGVQTSPACVSVEVHSQDLRAVYMRVYTEHSTVRLSRNLFRSMRAVGGSSIPVVRLRRSRGEIMRRIFLACVNKPLRPVVWELLRTRDYLASLPITDCPECKRITNAKALLQPHQFFCAECSKHTWQVDYCLPHSLEYMRWKSQPFNRIWSRVRDVFEEVNRDITVATAQP